MKKLILTFVTVVLLAVGIVGCAAPDTKEKETSNEVNHAKVVDNLKMSIKKVAIAEKGKNKQLELDMLVINNDSIEQPIGANDFKLKTPDGKTKAIDGSAVNFGAVIPKGKQLEGKMYFEVPESVTEGTVVYQPEKKVLAEWKIKF